MFVVSVVSSPLSSFVTLILLFAACLYILGPCSFSIICHWFFEVCVLLVSVFSLSWLRRLIKLYLRFKKTCIQYCTLGSPSCRPSVLRNHKINVGLLGRHLSLFQDGIKEKLASEISRYLGNTTDDEKLWNNLLKVKVFFEEFNYENIEETPAYSVRYWWITACSVFHKCMSVGYYICWKPTCILGWVMDGRGNKSGENHQSRLVLRNVAFQFAWSLNICFNY